MIVPEHVRHLESAITDLVAAHRRALLAHHRMMHAAGGLTGAALFLLVVAAWDASWPHAAGAVLLALVAVLLVCSAVSPKRRVRELEQFVDRLGER